MTALLAFTVGLIVGGVAIGATMRVAQLRTIEAATNAAVRCGADYQHFQDAFGDELLIARGAPLTPLKPRR